MHEDARELKEAAQSAFTDSSNRVLDSIRLRRIAAPIVSVNAAAPYSGEVARANAPTEMSTVPVHRPPSRLLPSRLACILAMLPTGRTTDPLTSLCGSQGLVLWTQCHVLGSMRGIRLGIVHNDLGGVSGSRPSPDGLG